MTEIKNSSQTETTTALVTVKLSKLTEGVGTIFAGVLTMLEALDADTADSIARSFLITHENNAADAAKEEKQYAAAFAGDSRKLFKIGINFSTSTRRIDGWKLV